MAHPQTESTARPRPDDTPPRNRVIFAYTVMSVIALVALGFLFDSYMDISRRESRRLNVEGSWTSEALATYREEQRAALERGRTPIDRAIADLARQDRRAFPLIRPTTSEDQGPLVGWSQLPQRAAASEEAATTPAGEAAPQGGTSPAEGAAAPAQGAPGTPTEGASPTTPTEGARPSTPTEGARPRTPTGGARPSGAAAPTAEPAPAPSEPAAE
jgi:hypothetical protein